ncbi:hypothetical protein AX16_001367 [Volvariella volvacea WC 439]|nr:hypothetical protein AX16_001367 [Volvariella volvacea WC 439]
MSNQPAKLNISLEPHAAELLRSIVNIVSQDLQPILLPYTTQENLPSTIPYDVLFSVSKWARTPAAVKTLESHTPSIRPQEFNMVSLLAGATTSPERKFPPPDRVKEPEEIAAEQLQERKAITTLVNSLLSIAGAGFASWWAAEKTGWKNEWRVLFALFVATVVAVAEGVLFLIWQWRKTSPAKQRRRGRMYVEHKKDRGEHVQVEGNDTSSTVDGVEVHDPADLRRRRQMS